MNATQFDILALNAEVCADAKAKISGCEAALESKVQKTAEEIFAKGGEVKIVLVSGRSASGKTTFTKKVCKALTKMGRPALHVSLDDFFLGIEALPINSDGTYDMESIKGLDTALANACFGELLETGESLFPTFDFPKQSRGETWNSVNIGENGLIMIEGIHALNPILTENLSEKGILRMYIEPKGGYFLNDEEVFSPRDIRLIRRMTRDELFRGWSAEKTLIQWKSVLEGEKIYIEPYIDIAEIKISSEIEFEPCVFIGILREMLGKVGEGSPFWGEAQRILSGLANFAEINPEKLPKDSLLREFVG